MSSIDQTLKELRDAEVLRAKEQETIQQMVSDLADLSRLLQQRAATLKGPPTADEIAESIIARQTPNGNGQPAAAAAQAPAQAEAGAQSPAPSGSEPAAAATAEAEAVPRIRVVWW